MLVEMDCPICMSHMEKPIYTCWNGHSFCSCCNSLHKCPMCRIKLNRIRNIALENLIAVSVVRCPYYVLNCNFMSDALSVKIHMENCEFGTAYECPLKVATTCNWKGLLRDLPFHMLVHRNTLSLGWYEGDLMVFLKYYRNRYFKICRGFDNLVSRFSCQYIGAPANASNYGMMIYLDYNDGSHAKKFCPCIPITSTENVFNQYCFPVLGQMIEKSSNLESHKLYFAIIMRDGYC